MLAIVERLGHFRWIEACECMYMYVHAHVCLYMCECMHACVCCVCIHVHVHLVESLHTFLYYQNEISGLKCHVGHLEFVTMVTYNALLREYVWRNYGLLLVGIGRWWW